MSKIIFAFIIAQYKFTLVVRLYWGESKRESDIVFKWLYRESNLMFTLNCDKIQRRKFALMIAFAQCQ